MFSRSPRLLVPVLLFTSGCGGSGQKAPTVDLPVGTDPLIAPVGIVTDAIWLSDDRWVVIAPEDQAVDLVDFGRRTVARFDKSAARAFAQPFYMFRTGDSLVIGDWQMRRATVWSVDGHLGRTIPARDDMRGALPRARDAKGRWYFELRPIAGPDGAGNRDSAAIIRTEADFSGPDTVARLAPFDLAEVVSEGRRRFERRLLSGQDRWGVLPDGSVWVARVDHNRVDWTDPAGRTHRGPELPDKVFPVTEPDREIFLQRFPPELRATAEQTPFVPIKPPFEGAFAAPSGEVWLVKSRAVGDSLRSNQVIGRDGALIREVRNHAHGKLVAADPGRVLLAEPFEGGVRLFVLALPQ